MSLHVSHYQSNHQANACNNHGTAVLITTPRASATPVEAKQAILNKKHPASFQRCTK